MEACTKNAHSHRRRTRRGKKRSRFLTRMTPYCGCPSRLEPEGDSCEKCNLGVARLSDNQVNTRTETIKKSKPCLRPPISIGAPHNSNQFLIEDHLASEEEFKITDLTYTKHDEIQHSEVLNHDDSFYGNCCVYYKPSDQCLSPDGEAFNWKRSPAFTDIDYKYVPVLDDEDMILFQQKDFEQVYQCTREQELMTKDRRDLISGIHKLRTDVDNLREIGTLQKKVQYDVSCDSSIDIISLQKEMDELKKDNLRLAQENLELKRNANVVHLLQ